MTSLVLRCSPYYTNSALYPVIEHLQRLLHFHREDTPEEKLNKLEHSLREYRFARDEVIPLFAALLSVPLPAGRYPPLHLSPQQQKSKTAEALEAWLVEAAERQPLLAVWEDLHWADPSTLELLNLIIDQSRTARMLTLLTCRPEFQPPWPPRSHLTHLACDTPAQPRTAVFRLGLDPGVACRVLAAVTRWLLGYPDQALTHIHEALALALSHPYSLAYARLLAAFVMQFRRDVPAVHEHAAAAVALATEQGFPHWAAMGTVLWGWALAMQGQREEGRAQIGQGIAAFRTTGAAV